MMPSGSGCASVADICYRSLRDRVVEITLGGNGGASVAGIPPSLRRSCG